MSFILNSRLVVFNQLAMVNQSASGFSDVLDFHLASSPVDNDI